jgi:hypothetical protein
MTGRTRYGLSRFARVDKWEGHVTRRKVSIKRVCECTCEDYEKIIGRQSQAFVWCKHIYAIMQKVLKFNRNNSLMKQIALNKKELTTIFNRTPDLTGLN